MSVSYFHGYPDTYRYSIGYWRTTNRERKQLHTVEHARKIVYKFSSHVHPYAERLMGELVRKDIAGLERIDTETDLRRTFFSAKYKPSLVIDEVDPSKLGTASVAVVAAHPAGSTLPDAGLPVRDLDFDYQQGAYAVYNWEVFYHAPYIIALHLSKNGRFADAQRWFHYIFDPTDNSDPAQGPKRFWKVKPFKIDEVTHIEQELFNLATGDDPARRDSTVRAIGAWRDSPLRPHLVARTRPSAYMYATVMAYLDNLIAWGDSLFRQDTRESINEAMQLYVLAVNILGPRPQSIPARASVKKQSYASLKNSLDAFSNAAVGVEAELAGDLFPPPPPVTVRPEDAVIESIGRSLYFCVPRNERLLGYWDTVADRLFKIRNSLNLSGSFRQLALFAPPIDPAMLARAVAAGVDVGAIVAGTADALAPVRFPFFMQKALELSQEVKSLGSQLLSAIEKKDAERLGVLRSRHELSVLKLVEVVKYAQWQEAVKSREGIEVNLVNAFQRYRQYDRLLGTDDANIKQPKFEKLQHAPFDEQTAAPQEPDGPPAEAAKIKLGSSFRDGGRKISEEEGHELDLLEAGQIAQDVSAVVEAVGAVLNLIPNIEASVKPWGLGAGATFGGSNLGQMFNGLAAVGRAVAGRINHEASMAGKMGGYVRREQEWALQRQTAAGEMAQLYKQLRGAEIREYIALREREHHKKQIEQSQDVLEFLSNEENRFTGDRRKTTTEDFYVWLRREAQGLHSEAFQFAYELAKKAEKALQYELGDSTLRFIDGNYLAGREGLLAGEKLFLDLKRLEVAYTERNLRELELTKHVSLKEWFPLKLLELRRTGKCQIDLPEALFDLDCPGHSFRRIKNAALSIPCVTGPYASVNCNLTLTQSYVRKTAAGYGNSPAQDTNNFVSYPAAVTSMVTSNGQSDAGVFEANLRDERFLPFEGAGAISSWSLELLGNPKPFDYDTIADVVLTLRYTARTKGAPAAAQTAALSWLKANSARVFSMRHEFASEWAAFKRAVPAGTKAELRFRLSKDYFSYRTSGLTEQPKKAHLFFAGDANGDIELFCDDKSLGKSAAASGMTFSGALKTTAEYKLVFDSNDLDDLWLVTDWAG
jgi:hypothetical protein